MRRAESARRIHPMRWAGRLICVLAVLGLAAGLAGCDDEEFGDAERREVKKVLQTGADMDSDPHVQAETMRVLEILSQPSMAHFAEGLVEHPDSAMVRVAALRVLLASGHKDIRRAALAQFNAADEPEKMAILEAVLEYGAPPLKRVVTARALRSSDQRLRRVAFERGPLARLKKAKEEGNTSYLENTLFPEVGQYVNDEDEELAAKALSALVEAGQPERAESMLETLGDTSADRDKRLAAARVLWRARIEAAEPLFAEILQSVDISDEGEFVVPKRIDSELVRAATLGLVARGQIQYVPQVQSFLNNAGVEESVEVLDALSTNPSEDAAVSLKIAMQDARQPVRHRAIELYADNEHADARAFISATRTADFETRKQLAGVLTRQYPDQWAQHLSEQLADEEVRLETLTQLRDLILTPEDAAVLEPLSDQLYKLAAEGDEEVAPLAALLLVRVAADDKSRKLLANIDDLQTRYAYLEYLVHNSPAEHVDYFRKNFRSDAYAIRLMSAAGMLLAFDAGEPQRGEEAAEGAEA